jgi:putative FmdB family regulatory protein
MPFYEYECKNCGKRFEKMQSIMAEPLTECIHCGGGPIRRVLQPVGVIFKGSGWYITDSKKSSASKADGKSKAAKEDSTPASESKGSEGKASEGTTSESKSSESAAKSESPSKPSSPD